MDRSVQIEGSAVQRTIAMTVLRGDRVHKYRQRSSILFERHVLGFQDGKMLVRVAQVNRLEKTAVTFGRIGNLSELANHYILKRRMSLHAIGAVSFSDLVPSPTSPRALHPNGRD